MTTSVATTGALPAVRKAPTNKWLVTLSVTFGTLMGAIDSSIVNVAMPHIRGAVGATVQEITWVTTGFVIATVLVMPLTGFLGPHVRPEARLHGVPGRCSWSARRCAASRASCPRWSLFRVLQGFGAGALQPTEQAILRQTFPPKEQGMAMAIFGMAVMVGPAFGPTLGGYIVDNWHWPWIFYINLPVGHPGPLHGAALRPRAGGHPRRQPRAAAERSARTWTGPASRCCAMGLAALQYVLEEGSRDDWFESHVIVALRAARGHRARRVRHPRADRGGARGEPAPLQGPGVRAPAR